MVTSTRICCCGTCTATWTWPLVITPEDVDVCDQDPGSAVTATIDTGLRTFTQVWRGDLTWREAVHSGQLNVDGPEQLCRAVPRWFRLSASASVERPA